MWNIWEFRYNVQVDRVVEYITLREGIRKKKQEKKEGEKGGRRDGRMERWEEGERKAGKQKAGILLCSPQVISRNDPHFHGYIISKRMNWCLSKQYDLIKWLSHSYKILAFSEIINSSVSN